MNTFVNAAIQTPDAFTENGDVAFKSSLSTAVDLFFRVGASRQSPFEAVSLFNSLYKDSDSKDLAIRLLLWARDARQGAGERNVFREMVKSLTRFDRINLIEKIVEVGRWDDLLSLMGKDGEVDEAIANYWKTSISQGNALAAKWAPRKGPHAVALRALWNLSPKAYRKFIVNATNVVEQKMCAKDWDSIEFSHVPSVAAARYNAAFYRNALSKYTEYKDALVAGETKINAKAMFPHDVVRGRREAVEASVMDAQWKALPDFTDGKASDILVMSDVSDSMFTPVSGSVTALDISIALGLFVSERQKGPFKDLVLTFSSQPTFHKVHGNGIVERINNLSSAKWGMTTNIDAALDLILITAINNKVSKDELPKMLIILSDMEFDASVRNGTLTQRTKAKFAEAGYDLPKIVFWNLSNRSGAIPVRFNQAGVALVSGFSPSIMKSLMAGEEFTPESIMLKTVMVDRYRNVHSKD